MSGETALAGSRLFEGLAPAEREAVVAQMRPRQFAAGEQLCAAGEPSDRIWLITAGLVNWTAGTTAGGGEIELRMRKGDVIGAQDAITGAERTATVFASTVAQTLELDAADLLDLAGRFPQILVNVIQSQRERLFRASARSAALFSSSARSNSNRGEEIGIVAGESLRGTIGAIVAAARAASPHPVTVLDRSLSFAGALTRSDDLASVSDTVLIPSAFDPDTLGVLLDEVDRVVALVGNGQEAEQLGVFARSAEGRRLEIVLVSDEARRASQMWHLDTLKLVVRDCPRQPEFPIADADIAWIARHLTRTKLGVALGAGGAKGCAHVGVLQVLEEAGYAVDFAAGASVGGFIATQLALGKDAASIDAQFRASFDEETVAKIFAGPVVGAAGLEVFVEMLRAATDGRRFSDAVIPLSILTVDLTARAPVTQRSGELHEALLAAMSVAGVFPTVERDGHRLIDAIALVPVPTAAVLEDGADIVVSVNLLGQEKLERWPGAPEPEPEPERKRRRGALDTMFEAMDLSQVDTSARHAALADVAITPRFGPGEWRDFQNADLYLQAGREAALAQLTELQALSRPVDLASARRSTNLI